MVVGIVSRAFSFLCSCVFNLMSVNVPEVNFDSFLHHHSFAPHTLKNYPVEQSQSETVSHRSRSRNSLSCMKSEKSLPCPQELATGPYPHPIESITRDEREISTGKMRWY